MKITKLIPATKDYIWGGTKLKTLYKKEANTDIVAETWELSMHKDGPSKTESGELLKDVVTKETLGTNLRDFEIFPVLIKLIDAEDNLSVQVHPSDEYALVHENSLGKTEMWYIIDAKEGAGIYVGFKKKITKAEYMERIQNNTLLEVLNFIPVKSGDYFFIPAGTVHAIGKGVTICEIQQNSNITYRVYDHGRVDKFGKSRELHIDKALDVSNLSKYLLPKQAKRTRNMRKLCSCKYFTTYEYLTNGVTELETNNKSFHAISIIEGSGDIDGNVYNPGDTFFVPADYGKYQVNGDGIFLLTKIEKYYVGVDLGGTNIKAGVVLDLKKNIISDKIRTEAELGPDHVKETIRSKS